MIDLGDYIIVCPVSDSHEIDVKSMVCADCGCEAISISETEFMEGAW